MSFDDFLKQIFKEKYGDAIKSEINVGTLEKSFDLWLLGKHPLIQNSYMIPSIFKEYSDNIIEYKSSHDNYNIYDILKLIGDASYFAFNRKLSLKNILKNACLWFLVVNPMPFKKFYKINGIRKLQTPGWYFYPNNYTNIRIIVINELEPDKKENSLLLLQSSGECFKGFLNYLLKNEDLILKLQKYLSLKFIIDNKELSKMAEVQEIKKKYSFEENVRSWIDDFGIKKVIGLMGINKVISEIGFDKVISEIGFDKVISEIGIDKILDSLDIKSLKKAIKRKEMDKINHE